MTYTCDDLCLYLSVHLRQQAIAMCITHLLILKEEKTKMKRGERKIIKKQ